jgi:Family of unknown function (DUF6338)
VATIVTVRTGESKLEITEATLRLMLLGLPGIAAYLMISSIASRQKASQLDTIIRIFLLSILSYALLTGIYLAAEKLSCGKISLASPLEKIIGSIDKKDSLSIFWDIVAASLASVVVAFAWAYAWQYKLITKIARAIRASRRYGDEGLMASFLASEQLREKDDWLVVRDRPANVFYFGRVWGWSDSTHDQCELILLDVSVYANDDATFLYHTDYLYIERPKGVLSIETPTIAEAESHKQSSGDIDKAEVESGSDT